jgi:hypothetical protein
VFVYACVALTSLLGGCVLRQCYCTSSINSNLVASVTIRYRHVSFRCTPPPPRQVPPPPRPLGALIGTSKPLNCL